MYLRIAAASPVNAFTGSAARLKWKTSYAGGGAGLGIAQEKESKREKDIQTKTKSQTSLALCSCNHQSCLCNLASSLSSFLCCAWDFDLAVVPDMDSVYSLPSTETGADVS